VETNDSSALSSLDTSLNSLTLFGVIAGRKSCMVEELVYMVENPMIKITGFTNLL